MTTLSLILPVLQSPDATEDVKINNAFTTIQGWSTGVDIDNMVNGSLGTAWTAYTPTWSTSGTQPVLGNGSLTGAFQRFTAKSVAVRIFLVAGPTTNFGTGTVWDFGLPFAVRGDGTNQTLSGYATPGTGPGVYSAFGLLSSGATFVAAYAGDALVTSTAPAVWVSGGALQLQGVYEAA